MFTVSDKDWSEINACKAVFPDAKHQLCFWHVLWAIKKCLSILCHMPGFYSAEAAYAEFNFIDCSFLPTPQALVCLNFLFHICLCFNNWTLDSNISISSAHPSYQHLSWWDCTMASTPSPALAGHLSSSSLLFQCFSWSVSRRLKWWRFFKFTNPSSIGACRHWTRSRRCSWLGFWRWWKVFSWLWVCLLPCSPSCPHSPSVH